MSRLRSCVCQRICVRHADLCSSCRSVSVVGRRRIRAC